LDNETESVRAYLIHALVHYDFGNYIDSLFLLIYLFCICLSFGKVLG